MQACTEVKKECDAKLEVRKREFNEMKKAIEVIS